MNIEIAKAIFLLAGIETKGFHQLVNEYWPDHENYDKIRRENPWWLVNTVKYGLIKIGWRKRVIQISWNDTDFSFLVTKDQVTCEPKYVHAWSYADAVKYLVSFAQFADQKIYADEVLKNEQSTNPSVGLAGLGGD